jgi:hypothetical protein
VTPQPIQAGQQLPAADYYRLSKDAQTQRGVQMNVRELQARIEESQSATEANKARTREENLTTEEKQQNLQAARDFAPWLAGANGDPVIAMQNMAADPKAKQKLGLVEQLYGPGNLERARQETLGNLEKTIDENEKVLNEHSQPGATPLPADESDDLRAEIKQAQAKRNQYLGLHPADPNQFADSVLVLDKVPADQRAAFITSSAAMPPAAKIYLLKHYNLPVPANLTQPQAPTQGQPTGLAGSIRSAVQQTDAGNRAQ